MIPSPDTIAAIATPPGRGGVGIVRVSGAGARTVAAGVVGKSLVPRVATRAVFRGGDGEAIDEGLAIFFPAPNSYTGESVLELHGHGGPVVLRLVLARCLQLGARLAQPGEFTQRAFLNGKIDLVEAEGVADLIDAATSTAARAAVRSLAGEFSREVHALVDALTELRMFTEATLDFPEEDIDFLEAADARGKLAAIRAGLDAILGKARQGALLRDGLAVVLIGQPNVGKSSLMNRLVGDDVAIVTEIAGTTRDTVTRQIEVAGVPLTVIDTAGLRPTRDPIETLGIERTWNAVERADLAIVIVDARDAGDGLSPADAAIAERLPSVLPRIVVHNKVDLLTRAGESPRVGSGEAGAPAEGAARVPSHVWLSAKTGEGIDVLRQQVLTVVGAAEAVEGAFIARERHLEALRATAARLDAAERQLMGVPPPLELFAEELRLAQTALATITGEFSSDDLLGVIFSRFCLGK